MNGYSNPYSKNTTPFKPYQMPTLLKTKPLEHGYEQNSLIDYVRTAGSPKISNHGAAERVCGNDASDGIAGNLTINQSMLLSQNTALLTKCKSIPLDDPYNFVDDNTNNSVSSQHLITPVDVQHIRPSYSIMQTMHDTNSFSKLSTMHQPNVNKSIIQQQQLDMIDIGGPKKRGRKKKVSTDNVE